MTDLAVVESTLDVAEARALTDQIKVAVSVSWQLVARAYVERAWAALGYGSWDDYMTREFGDSRLRLPREERDEVVASLREQGLSVRAIAAATGTGRGTVARTLAGVPNGTPEQSAIDVTPDLFDTAPTPDESPVEPVAVKGTDGKTYAPKAKATPKRSALPDAAMKAGHELRKATERLNRIAEDDRFNANKEQVATHLRGHLQYAVEVCQDLLDQLNTEDPCQTSI